MCNFAKSGLPHTSNLLTMMPHIFTPYGFNMVSCGFRHREFSALQVSQKQCNGPRVCIFGCVRKAPSSNIIYRFNPVYSSLYLALNGSSLTIKSTGHIELLVEWYTNAPSVLSVNEREI